MFSALVSFMHLYILLVTNNRSDRHIKVSQYHSDSSAAHWIMDHGCFIRGVWSPGRVCRGWSSRAAIYVLATLYKQCWIVIYYSNYHLRDCASHHAAMLRAAHERHLVLSEVATQCDCACPCPVSSVIVNILNILSPSSRFINLGQLRR